MAHRPAPASLIEGVPAAPRACPCCVIVWQDDKARTLMHNEDPVVACAGKPPADAKFPSWLDPSDEEDDGEAGLTHVDGRTPKLGLQPKSGLRGRGCQRVDKEGGPSGLMHPRCADQSWSKTFVVDVVSGRVPLHPYPHTRR